MEVALSEIVMCENLLLTGHEKAILKEMVELLEPFEEATDILQGDRFVTISFAIPRYVGLLKHLSSANVLYYKGLRTALKSSLEQSLNHICEYPTYITTVMLDPKFKLSWCEGVEKSKYKRVLLSEAAKFSSVRNEDDKAASTDDDGPPRKKKREVNSFHSWKVGSEKNVRTIYLHEDQMEEFFLSLLHQHKWNGV